MNVIVLREPDYGRELYLSLDNMTDMTWIPQMGQLVMQFSGRPHPVTLNGVTAAKVREVVRDLAAQARGSYGPVEIAWTT